MHVRFIQGLSQMFLILRCWGKYSVLLLLFTQAFAQDLPPMEESALQEVEQLEAEIGKSPQKDVRNQERIKSEENFQPQRLSDLSKLAPFSEVSVIQKRFQPKTGRFQLNLGLGGLMNDPWFTGIGGGLKFGYHLSEAFGVEGSYSFNMNSEGPASKSLFDNLAVKTSSLVSTKGYMGVSVLWTPIYGKMSLFNKRIVPFDMYFSGGLGQSQLDGAKTSSASTVQLGTGQVFALTKSWGFRWDLGLNTYSAASVGSSTSQQFNNLFLTLGGSYFFPDVGER